MEQTSFFADSVLCLQVPNRCIEKWVRMWSAVSNGIGMLGFLPRHDPPLENSPMASRIGPLTSATAQIAVKIRLHLLLHQRPQNPRSCISVVPILIKAFNLDTCRNCLSPGMDGYLSIDCRKVYYRPLSSSSWQEVDFVLAGLKPERRLDVVDFHAFQALQVSQVDLFDKMSGRHLHMVQSC